MFYILEECLTLLASGSDPTCLLGACQMPSDDVKESLCHFRWSSSAALYIYLFTGVHSTATDETIYQLTLQTIERNFRANLLCAALAARAKTKTVRRNNARHYRACTIGLCYYVNLGSRININTVCVTPAANT